MFVQYLFSNSRLQRVSSNHSQPGPNTVSVKLAKRWLSAVQIVFKPLPNRLMHRKPGHLVQREEPNVRRFAAHRQLPAHNGSCQANIKLLPHFPVGVGEHMLRVGVDPTRV